MSGVERPVTAYPFELPARVWPMIRYPHESQTLTSATAPRSYGAAALAISATAWMTGERH